MVHSGKPNRISKALSAGLSIQPALGIVAFVPALSLGAFWTGGETALLTVALSVPCFAALMMILPYMSGRDELRTGRSGVLAAAAFDAVSQMHLDEARASGLKSAVFMMEIDDYSETLAHHGQQAMDVVCDQIAARIRSAVRGHDEIAALSDSVFSVCLTPQPRLDLEICLELSGRINRALAEPYAIDGTAVYLTVSTGFCQLGRESASERDVGRDPVVTCAKHALTAAKAAAPGSIRAYSHESRKATTLKSTSAGKDAVSALENGDIVAWFQPQISTDTGQITGFEALARWNHPSEGVLPPLEFIPQLESAGQMDRLAEVILYNALTAVRAWDQAGVDVEQVGVNFSAQELNDPKLVDKIHWELDRFELASNRLAVEILETVVASGPDDVVTRNIRGLSAMGCKIDLDDFGTGHASLSSIRRFGVSRIKIDRSFVMKADRDPEQRRMIRAILTMAEKLEIETLAEGVETVGEHSLLAQLGCTHVQGYGIGRPMPFDQTLSWIKAHNAKLQAPPDIGKATG